MNFLGLVWIASYMGSFFSPQSLLKTTDHIAKVFSAKALSVFGATAPQHPQANQASASVSNSTPTSVSTSSSASTLPIGWVSSRTQIPSIQSFLQPLSWLNPTESFLFRPEWAVRPSLTGPKTHFQFGPPVPSPFNLSDANKGGWRSRASSGRMVRLFASLSRWSETIGKHIKSKFPSVVVTQAPASTTREVKATTGQAAKAEASQCAHTHQQSGSQTNQPLFQVRVKGRLVAEVPTRVQAGLIAQRMRYAFQEPAFDPSKLQPAIVNDRPAGTANGELLFTVDEAIETALNRNGTLIAIDWINELRMAFSTPVLTLAEAQTKMYGLTPTEQILEGTASWYGPYFHGRLTATGETFDQHELTAAHPSLPFDTYLKVTNLHNGDSVVVRINDRGPYVGERSLDLSREAARCLGSETVGVVPYEAVILKPAPATAIAQTPSTLQSPSSSAPRGQQIAQEPKERDEL